MSDGSGFALEHLREIDPATRLAILYLPAEQRGDAAAIHAFRAEIARVSRVAKEPMAGEIRLQWWRDAIETRESGGNPLAAALLDAMARRDWHSETFIAACDARVFDLYHDPMPDKAAFETWAGECHAVFLQMASSLAGGVRASGDAAGHAGMTLAIAEVLHDLGWRRSRGQVFVPATVLSAAGTDAESWLSGPTDPAIAERVIGAMAAIGRDHAGRARVAIKALPKAQHAAFLPLATALSVISLAERAGADLLDRPLAVSSLRQHRALMAAALFGA